MASTFIELDKKYIANIYNRLPIAVASGKGAKVFDAEGKEYIDCMAGIASVSLGHSNPKVLKAMKEQAKKIMHVSNWVYNENGATYAQKLVEACGIGGKAFFCNSGTEAVEAALKLARKATGKSGIIAMENAFHGRTMGALSLTFGEKYKRQFEPLLSGVKHVPFNDVGAVANALDETIGAVIVEPIQGEAGVIIPDEAYLKELRKLCDEKKVLLI
ncbi:aspartate aminotransferase family protein, partial [Candidatus Micrarchaeota archaeon CG_4_10_14_0_2_um_filter_49_7]